MTSTQIYLIKNTFYGNSDSAYTPCVYYFSGALTVPIPSTLPKNYVIEN